MSYNHNIYFEVLIVTLKINNFYWNDWNVIIEIETVAINVTLKPYRLRNRRSSFSILLKCSNVENNFLFTASILVMWWCRSVIYNPYYVCKWMIQIFNHLVFLFPVLKRLCFCCFFHFELKFALKMMLFLSHRQCWLFQLLLINEQIDFIEDALGVKKIIVAKKLLLLAAFA